MTRKSAVPLPVGKRGSAEITAARLVLFAEAYLANGGNGKAAALEVGIRKSNAQQWASRAMKNREVAKRVSEAREASAKRFRLEADQVLAQLAAVVYFDPREMVDDAGNLLPIKQWPDQVAAAVASFEVDELLDDEGVVKSRVRKIKILDKNSAIEKAMRHLGQFAEDNKQKQGMLENVPPEVLKLIRDRLEAMSANSTAGRQ